MKILWFSNCILSDSATSSGTWLSAMASLLIVKGVELYNISSGSKSSEIEECDYLNIKQWALPNYKLKKGVPSIENINKIVAIVNSIEPDIIHIWGMECYWSMLYVKGYLKGKVLLDIQGIRSSCGEVSYGGLTSLELLKCIGTKELILPYTTLYAEKRRHEKWAIKENEILSSFKYISTQSEWTRSRIRPYINDDAKVFCTERSVRKEFLDSNRWGDPQNTDPVLVTVSSSPSPLKGVHFIIKAVALLKKRYPNIKLKIFGNFILHSPYWKRPGYYKFLMNMIKKLGLQENIEFTGPLNSAQMVEQMNSADVYVHASFVESYSLSFAEAMALGMPCVISFAGAMPGLARNKEAALFYTPGDYHLCADYVRQIFEDKDFANSLSKEAYKVSHIRNNEYRVRQIQLSIYEQIIKVTTPVEK